MKEIAFFTMLCGFVLAALGNDAWGWFLVAAVVIGVFA